MSLFSNLKKLFASSGGKGRGPRIDIAKRFDLERPAGQGSMSKAWRARDRKLGRVVCLKLLDRKKTADFEARFTGLKRPPEGAICMGLKHLNIVQTFEYGDTTKGEPFLVMEWIEGDGLNLLVDTNAPVLKGRRINYLIQLCDGIEYIHQQKFLHRDICPRNVMVTKDHVVKIIDFGLTIPFTPAFCKPGNRTGTAAYMAPELIKRSSTDHRVDLFALGVTAFEMFTHNMPWEKAASQQVLLSHLNSPGKDPRGFKPDMDERMARILMKSIERRPEDRYQTAGEFREALKALPSPEQY